ncbi:MAG: FtsL-like putative cell division protein [Crocinitomicaceae bacterium]|nr:FtsL-like putative cell division protein [Crocinitomicaceae bacterium]
MDNEFLDKAQLDEQNAAKEKELTKKEKRKLAKKEGKKKQKSNKPNAFVQILNGDFLTKEFMLNNLNFIFFIMFLLLLIVGKGYYGKQLSKEVLTTQQELDEISSNYFESKAKLEEMTRRTVLVEQLENTGLKETVNPTKVIRIKKEEETGE